MNTTRLIAAAVAATFVVGTGAAAIAAEKPRTAQSIECSKEADAKGLHGKERKKFRAHCKHEAKKEEKK